MDAEPKFAEFPSFRFWIANLVDLVLDRFVFGYHGIGLWILRAACQKEQLVLAGHRKEHKQRHSYITAGPPLRCAPRASRARERAMQLAVEITERSTPLKCVHQRQPASQGESDAARYEGEERAAGPYLREMRRDEGSAQGEIVGVQRPCCIVRGGAQK